jgi:hypothetical protein
VSWTWSTWNMVNSNNQLININNITSWLPHVIIDHVSYEWSITLNMVIINNDY